MADNNSKIILDLCGGTGSWSRSYKEAGYDVRIITLPEFDVCTYRPPDKVYGILAAPPCTEFSLAKNGCHRSRDLSEGMNIVAACLKIIWECRLTGSLKFWALENPVGLLRQFLGKPHYTFYQWWFGDMGIKRTDLWGYFNDPKQKVFERPDSPYFVNWSSPQCPEWAREYIAGCKNRRAALRAITPPGFAQAFFKANR